MGSKGFNRLEESNADWSKVSKNYIYNDMRRIRTIDVAIIYYERINL